MNSGHPKPINLGLLVYTAIHNPHSHTASPPLSHTNIHTTYTHRDTHTDPHTDTHTDIHIHTHSLTHTHTETHTHKPTHRQTCALNKIKFKNPYRVHLILFLITFFGHFRI